MPVDNVKVGVIGLGYVGLPVAVAFGRLLPVVGFDINTTRIAELTAHEDVTRETDAAELASAQHLMFSSNVDDLADCTVYIVTVPTPVDSTNRPDIGPLLQASETVGRVIKPGDTVVFESTVYPGATEDDCVPVIEKASGLTFNEDFYAGYSPERINPGDRKHRLADIVKVTSGSTPEAAAFIDGLYRRIITAGTHLAPSIRVAEAAKVIENIQRDVNIALINELAMLFKLMDLDTIDVLQAAGTKWNFLPFRPGLVGGHCIGVDPYYLTHKAQSIGFEPELVLAGRRTNDGMGNWIVQVLIREMISRDFRVKGTRVLVSGLTFKEDVPDLRNSKVADIVHGLRDYGIAVDIWDPLADAEEVSSIFGLPVTLPEPEAYDVVVLAVPHADIRTKGREAVVPFLTSGGFVIDVKSVLPRAEDTIRI